jgi:hypothetical protein
MRIHTYHVARFPMPVTIPRQSPASIVGRWIAPAGRYNSSKPLLQAKSVFLRNGPEKGPKMLLTPPCVGESLKCCYKLGRGDTSVHSRARHPRIDWHTQSQTIPARIIVTMWCLILESYQVYVVRLLRLRADISICFLTSDQTKSITSQNHFYPSIRKQLRKSGINLLRQRHGRRPGRKGNIATVGKLLRAKHPCHRPDLALHRESSCIEPVLLIHDLYGRCGVIRDDFSIGSLFRP